MRDPYYQKILEGLAGPLDPKLFEECAVDLLRDVYSGLVPIHGGGDYGMDGAIADGEGVPYPLIVTTAQDVGRNLDNSLDSYLRGGGPRRRAVVATSTALTPKDRRALEARAEEKEFLLLQIHEQRDFTNRLHGNSRWAKKLLGVTGEPPALSANSLTRRPLREDLELVGRDADLEWLRTTPGDRLIVGQPGSGKTYLTLQLVREGEALFLASDNEQWIAEAFRDLKPAIVIVDDAHLDPMKLDRLRHLRGEVGHFDIVASSWPSFQDECIEALGGIPIRQVRELELLTRRQIVEVLRGMGVGVSDDSSFMRELVDQAANKPGLAVTLGSLWLRGEARDLFSGEGIRRTLIPTLTRVLEHDPTQLLAGFALGGSRGVAMAEVIDFLGYGLAEARSRVVQAAQGGLLNELGRGVMVVQPAALRAALLRHVFFGVAPLSYQHLLPRVESMKAAVETLTASAHRGVDIPRDELRALVEEHGSEQAWSNFAALGDEEARWVLDHYPGPIEHVLYAALDTAPRIVTPLLLAHKGIRGEEAEKRVLAVLEEWLREVPLGDQREVASPMEKRTILAKAAVDCLQDQQRRESVCRRAALLTLDPTLRTSRDTVDGRGVKLYRTLVPLDAWKEADLWKPVISAIDSWDQEVRTKMEEVLSAWTYPQLVYDEPDDVEGYRDVARNMVRDLSRSNRSGGGPGFGEVLRKWARDLGMPVPVPENEEFATLFPLSWDGEGEFSEWHQDRHREVEVLAREWAGRDPGEAIVLFERYREEAERSGLDRMMLAPFCRALAAAVENPQKWLTVTIERRIASVLLALLLIRVLEDRNTGWQEALEICLRDDELAEVACSVALEVDELPHPILQEVLSSPALSEFTVETACLRQETPLTTLRMLLEHPRPEIARAAAIGEWLGGTKGTVRREIRDSWEGAVVRSAETSARQSASALGDHWLKAIIASEPSLAIPWMESYLRAQRHPFEGMSEELTQTAIEHLTLDDKRRLLLSVPPNFRGERTVHRLVGDSLDLYREMLAIDRLRPVHLAPLQGKAPDDLWWRMADLAVEARHEPEAIAWKAFEGGGPYSVTEPSHWQRWLDAFSSREADADPDRRAIAVHGRKIATERVGHDRARVRAREMGSVQ